MAINFSSLLPIPSPYTIGGLLYTALRRVLSHHQQCNIIFYVLNDSYRLINVKMHIERKARYDVILLYKRV